MAHRHDMKYTIKKQIMTALEWSVCERTDWLLNLGLRSAPTSHIPRVIRRQTHFVTHFIPGCKHSCVIPFN